MSAWIRTSAREAGWTPGVLALHLFSDATAASFGGHSIHAIKASLLFLLRAKRLQHTIDAGLIPLFTDLEWHVGRDVSALVVSTCFSRLLHQLKQWSFDGWRVKDGLGRCHLLFPHVSCIRQH